MNIGSEMEVTWEDVARAVMGETGLPSSVIAPPLFGR